MPTVNWGDLGSPGDFGKQIKLPERVFKILTKFLNTLSGRVFKILTKFLQFCLQMQIHDFFFELHLKVSENVWLPSVLIS